jgi:ribonuclease HI
VSDREVRIYTDGACIGNPGPGGWAALIEADGQREELSGAAPQTTNNRMELTAVIEALRRVPPPTPVRVITDSQYVMQGLTRWLPGWRRRGWRTANGQPVLNRDLWEQLVALDGGRVRWEWVRGHQGHPGNTRVDALARARAREALAQRRAAGAQEAVPPAAPTRPGTPADPASSRDRPRWPRYLSLVDGELRRHPDWPSCQRHVHGKRGARFKKCRSAAEEQATVAAWGLPPAALAALDPDAPPATP